MTRTVALIACWIACSSVTLGQKPDAAAAGMKALAGKWKVEKAEMSGIDAIDIYKGLTIEITETAKYTVVLGELRDSGKLTIDPSRKPAEMDITGTNGPNKDKTIKSIYKLDGDTLTICYTIADGDRPTKFETKAGSKLFLVVYKREKK